MGQTINVNAENEYRRWKETIKPGDELYDTLADFPESDIPVYFSSRIDFGTAGLRGIMTAGINAMNVYTVVQATRGLADIILDGACEDNAVVIACDSRINCELFTKSAATALAEKGISVLIFDGPRPTPELSFSVRHYGSSYKGKVFGINITASHNTKEYNGYKAYAPDGAQLSPEQASRVSHAISKIDVLEPLHGSFDEYVKSGIIKIIGSETDEEYMKCVLGESVDREIIANSDLSVVYTPLHGAGYSIVPEVLRRAGLKNLYTVPQQMVLDGSFPTVKSPNPENKEAFELGIALAREKNADIIVATDPDADRIGIAVKVGDEYRTLTGNRVGALLLEYIIGAYSRSGGVLPGAYAVKSIVSTPLADKICQSGGVQMYNVLTGFKFIGEVIEKKEKEGNHGFVLGFEESYGYLKGSYARDKDSVVAALLICEMAAYRKSVESTLAAASDELDEKYGFFREIVRSVNLGIANGEARKTAIMGGLRECPPTEIGGIKVVGVRDYLEPVAEGTDAVPLPLSDVLYYSLEGGGAVVVRPSGTEPKVKFYCMVSANDAEQAEIAVNRCCDDMSARLN